MSIDVLSQSGETPVIVGDEGDMADILGVGIGDTGDAHLVMKNSRGAPHKVLLSAEASRNLAGADHVLLITTKPDYRVVSACRMTMDNLGGEVKRLSQQEIDELTLWWQTKAID